MMFPRVFVADFVDVDADGVLDTIFAVFMLNLRGSGSHRRAEVGDDDARRPERRSSEVRADVETRANARTSLLP